MADLTSVQLAERLGITRRRALDLLADGRIDGRQLTSGAWLVDSDSVARYESSARRGSGRGLNASTAWGMLWLLSGLDADWLSERTAARVRARLRTVTAESLARAVSGRTRAHRYQAANAAKAADGLIATGRAVAGSLGVGLMDDRRTAVGYAKGTAAEHAASRFMVEGPTGQHIVYDNTLPIDYAEATMPAAVIAADLAGSTDTRERAGGLRALEELRNSWLARN